MPRPTKTRQARQAALREELKSREYLRQIHAILEKDWQPDETAVQSSKLSGYFRLLAKTLPDAREDRVMLDIDHSKPLSQRAETVANAALSGEITTGQADSLLSILERVAEIKAVHELESRILKLEIANGSED